MDDLELSLPFKDKLRGIRNIEELTMVQLSNLSGLSQSYISQLENGKLPSDENIAKLAKGLSKGRFSSNLDRDTSEDYEKTLKSSRDHDELLIQHKALIEATKRFEFERNFEKDEFLKSIDRELQKNTKRGLVSSLSDFFGFQSEFEESLTSAEHRIIQKYRLLDNARNIKVEEYIDFLLFEQSKLKNK
ncbi:MULTISPECIES: helix-turn-helix domain-containing protein [Enterococcus]|uniref:helix-turn-helix domain-containing protein n=1 Tax=Enterococcus TaxID=1350 RepID=UPI002DBB671F|nr:MULTISPECIES: helix-turn-helix transcriptional regulator [Enterococcus]MEB5953171.1 helix-turn-helix domain-containing protein [Enterococcus innesii]MEB8400548.1 helix-turn-helix domain-containing protein [Enterococcus casseliflavus]